MSRHADTGQLHIAIPRPTLVVLCGPAGSGKSTFAARHFLPTQTVSSDACRAMLSDDPSDQSVSGRAFALMHYLIGERLALGRFTVADSTALAPDARADLRGLARRADFLTTLIVFNTPLEECLARDARRERPVGETALRRQHERLELLLADRERLARERFDQVIVLTPEQAAAATVEVVPPLVDRSDLAGPFDLIGDVHGCYDELAELLGRLGYQPDAAAGMRHPVGRTAVFLGDLIDRGPRSLDVARLVMAMAAAGTGLFVVGNHDFKFARWLAGRRVRVSHGMQRTVEEFSALAEEEQEQFRAAFTAFVRGAPPYLLLRGGRLAAVHGALPEDAQGRISERIRNLCLYGDATGETDERGYPVRRDWAADYRGRTLVAYGHQVAEEARFYHNTIDLDQGCVFGGKLSALRYPEMEIVQVAARRVYYDRV